MPAPTAAPVIDLSFPHLWQARILPARPAILPMRHYVYPRHAEEIERGALELLIQPLPELEPGSPGAPGLGSPRTGPRPGGGDLAFETWESRSHHPGRDSALPFLATCALGFRDPSVPTGLWSTPSPDELCAVSGGYAYLIRTTDPEHFTMLPYRPVMEVHPAAAENLLLFVSHRSILAWGPEGQAWEAENLSDEGITGIEIAAGQLRGLGWQMRTDKEAPFVLDLRTGQRVT